jgi:hypothetical protein
MKPRNKFQKRVVELSGKLSPITKVRKQWAYQNCMEHIGRRTCKGVITCLDCGHSWKGNSELSDNLLGWDCPVCGVKLKITTTRKRVFRQEKYLCAVTAKKEFQVLRFFHIAAFNKTGQKAHYSTNEVAQRWIAPDGRHVNIAKLRTMNFCTFTWNFASNLEIRPEKSWHNLSADFIFPRQKLIPEMKRSGYKGDCYELTPFDLFHTLLSDSRAETLIKAGEIKILRFFIYNGFKKIDNYWQSVKICIRNGYQISDVSIWCDYINLLRFFGKDVHNAKYVCPADLKAEHDRYVKKKKDWQEREKSEKAQKKAAEDEKYYKEMKAIFFGIQFTDGVIHVRVLESVEEIRQEGDILKHCVFASDYHLKPDSLILSATVNGQKTETVELSISKLKVLQCRGIRNQNTEYHERIIELVNKNIRLIEQRKVA